MTTCHLCGERPAWADGLTLCEDCEDGYQASPEWLEQYRSWESTGALVRPNPDPWWQVAEQAVADYVRRVQAERRNGGAQ